MALKLLSWNIEGRLSPFSSGGRGTPDHIVSEIKRHDADVVVLLEASDGENIPSEITRAVARLGYEVHTAYYDDEGVRQYAAEDNPTIKLLSRLPVTRITTRRYGGVRNSLIADITDREAHVTYRVFGIHLDDRSEANRTLQMRDIIKEVKKSPHPTVLAGDFNAMHAHDYKAKVLRAVLPPRLTRRAPAVLMMDIISRVHDMASGSVLAMLETETGLRDIDRKYRATSTPKLRSQTWLPSVRMIQIDHIYVSPDIETTDLQIASDGGSDHRAISAVLSIKTDKH